MASLDENGEVDKKEFLKKGDTTGQMHDVNIPLEKLKMAGDILPFPNKSGEMMQRYEANPNKRQEDDAKTQKSDNANVIPLIRPK